MKKWFILILVMVMFPIITDSIGIGRNLNNIDKYYHLSAYEEIQVKLKELDEEKERKIWQAEIKRFLNDIGFNESGNDYKKYFYNKKTKRAYIGKYQFGYAARKATGYGHIKFWDWIKNPDIWPEEDQDTAMIRYMKINKVDLAKYILDIDTLPLYINKINVSESGVLAAAHLSGSGNVKKFFRTKGKYNPKDAFGTKLSDYLTRYSGYKFNLN